MSEKSDTSPDNLAPDGYPAPRAGMLLTRLLIVQDVDRSARSTAMSSAPKSSRSSGPAS